MIRFSCKNCGKRIKVSTDYAGRKGRCPQCKNFVIVPNPEPEDQLVLKPIGSDDYKAADPEPSLRLKHQAASQTRYEGLSADGMNVSKDGQPKPIPKEQPPSRSLPWIIDIFLYPTSMSGLINLGIFWVLINILSLIPFFIFWLIALFIFGGYIYYYYLECTRESADGEIRAPDNVVTLPDTGEAVTVFCEIVASFVIFWLPVVGYSFYKGVIEAGDRGVEYNALVDPIFWSLLGYGVFFFPMGVLVLAMFDSASVLFNPFLWIISILKTFFHYIGLVLFLSLLFILFNLFENSFGQSFLVRQIFLCLSIYMTMINFHLIGRFYYKNSHKLNWEV